MTTPSTRASRVDDLVHERVELEPVLRADGRAPDRAMTHRHHVGDAGELGDSGDQLVGLELLRVIHVLPDVERVASDRRDRPARAYDSHAWPPSSVHGVLPPCARDRDPPWGVPLVSVSVPSHFRRATVGARLRAVSNTKLRIVIFQEGDWLSAHCLEYDFATQARNLADLRYDLERMIVGHIAVSLENGLKPFRKRRRAPEKYWALFRRSKISLPPQSFGLHIKKRGVKIPTPEIRVAPLAA